MLMDAYNMLAAVAILQARLNVLAFKFVVKLVERHLIAHGNFL